jgi:hypothetical protein
MIDPVKVLLEVLPKAVERYAVQKPIIGHEAHDAIAPTQPIRGPAEELHIRVIELARAAGLRVPCVRFVNPAVHDLILAFFVVVVLASDPRYTAGCR